MSEPVDCTACGGTGRQRSRACSTCHGAGRQTQARTIQVKIPAGVEHGTRVRVAGKGAAGSRGGKRGNLYLSVQVAPDDVFRPDGSDVHVTLPIWPWEAALGAEVLAPTLTGSVRVKVPLGSAAESKLSLEGKGLPTPSGKRGDLLITLRIVMPTPATEADRGLLEQLGRIPRDDPRADLLRHRSKSEG